MTIAQDEASSLSFEMPCAAIDLGKAEIILPPEKIAFAVSVLVNGTLPAVPPGAATGLVLPI